MSRLEMYLITTSALGLLGLAAEDVAANTEAARRAAQRAERMIAGSDYQGAERSLATLDCGDDTGCQTLIDFSYGWLYESWADSDPMGERERLGRAQAYYSRAHKRSPSNIQILNNLALVSRRIGDARTTASAVESAIELDPDLEVDQLYDILKKSAIDMNDPATGGFDSGFDFGTGYGLIHAFRAANRVDKAK